MSRWTNQFSSLAQSCQTVCNPMNHSTAGLPVHHQLLEFTQIHVHWVGDAIQPSHPLLSASLPALNLSQHQFNCSVMSDSLWSHEEQHARPPCPSPTPRVHPKPCPLCWWCHPTILSSVIPFSSCPQSFPASGSFQMSQIFTSGGQSIGVSALISVLPMNIHDWSPLGWTGWISLQSKVSQASSQTPQLKSINSLVLSFLYRPTLTSIHDYWKNHSFD